MYMPILMPNNLILIIVGGWKIIIQTLFINIVGYKRNMADNYYLKNISQTQQWMNFIIILLYIVKCFIHPL